MILLTFSIYDEKAKAYIPPFFMHRQAQAIRVFTDCLKDENHQFSKNPGDYTLWQIGAFDDDIGQATTDSRELLCNGLSCLSLDQEPDFPNVKISDDSPIPTSPQG